MVDIASGDRMEKADKDYLEQTYRESRCVIGMADSAREAKVKIIDKMAQSGSYTNAEECKLDKESLDEEARAWYRRCCMLKSEVTPVQEKHEEGSSMDGELRTAIRWLFAYLVLSLISGQIGWTLFFFL